MLWLEQTLGFELSLHKCRCSPQDNDLEFFVRVVVDEDTARRNNWSPTVRLE